MTLKSEWLLLVLLAITLPGCGVRPVVGGTAGVLHVGGETPGDIQITVHHPAAGGWQPVGFGITASDGSFELVANGAEGPLVLAAGEYRCTLESVGAPIQVPKEYTDAETTPLRPSWPENGDRLELSAPAIKSQ
jgi:hypothetical protein